MPLYWDWCVCAEEVTGRRRLWLLTEKGGGREQIWALLLETVRSHYDHLDRIAADATRLGYEKAAEILRTRMPTEERARSGDLGEILASELAEDTLGFRIPVKRLRFKDGRNMALRGDDFIGVIVTEGGQLRLLKGESKSRQELAKPAITEAREALDRDDGRCTPESLLFVADRLLDSSDPADQALGQALRDEIGHVAIGNHWYQVLCEERSLDPVETYAALTVQYKAPVLKGPFNLPARRAAGFSEIELTALMNGIPLTQE